MKNNFKLVTPPKEKYNVGDVVVWSNQTNKNYCECATGKVVTQHHSKCRYMNGLFAPKQGGESRENWDKR